MLVLNTQFLTTVFTAKLNHSGDSQFNIVTRAVGPLYLTNIPYITRNCYNSKLVFFKRTLGTGPQGEPAGGE